MHYRNRGASRTLLAAATLLAAPAALAAPALTPQASVSFDVALPLRNTDQLDALLKAQQDPASPQFHKWLTPREFGLRFGPDSATLARVAAELRAQGFAVEPHTSSLRATGSRAQIEAAFHTGLALAQAESGHTHVVATSALALTPALAAAHATVTSFSPNVMRPLSHVVATIPATSPQNRYSATGGYWYNDLKQAYSYPAAQATAKVKGKPVTLDGSGVTLGVLMSSDVLDSDIQAVFDHEHYSDTTGKPAPTLYKRVNINGGGGLTGDAFAEAALDTQEELTGAPGAHVILYNIPSLSDGDVFAGYVTIVESNEVDIVSSSFGGCELAYLPAYNGGQDYSGVLRAYHELFLQGNAQGITFLASSGDRAGKECPNVAYFKGQSGRFVPSISSPANDPNVTAVGGTNVVTGYLQGSLTSPYVGENAWSDPEIPYDVYGFGKTVSGASWGAGSGYSQVWSKPDYQNLVDTGSTTQRAIPDIGMQVGGCPGGIAKLTKGQCTGGNNPENGAGNTQRSYVIVAIDTVNSGYFYGLIGTSVSSPELAGALAPLVQLKGRQGNLNPYLYALAAKQAGGGTVAFHTNIPGYNGVQSTLLNSAYSLSTGVGTPFVNRLIGAPNAPVAGDPRTPSNP